MESLARTCLVVWAVASLPAAASTSPEPGGAAPGASEAVDLSTPRRAVAWFFQETRAGRFEDARKALDLPAGAADGTRTARELKAVLDRNLWIDTQEVSDEPEGRLDDGLSSAQEELGRVPGPSGKPEPVRLSRTGAANEVAWRFSRATVERVPGWYRSLRGRWALEHIPASLQVEGPLGLQRWQWLALLPLVLLAWTIGVVLGRVTRTVAVRLAQRTRVTWDEALASRMGGPLTLAWGLAAASVLVRLLDLLPPAQAGAERAIRAGFLVFLFWALLRGIDVGMAVAGASAWAKGRAGSRSLLAIGGRVGKILVLTLAAVATLSELGYPVASLLAGLGLGGLAFALAAQKTVENLFGALSIGVDQPIREGDFIRVEEMVGTVEAIGLRSTRIRTLDRTLVTIPNGRLADMRLESFTARDRIRLACEIGLVYETTPEQMRDVLAGLERVLRDHPLIWPDAVVVRFKQFGPSSLDIEVMAWFQTQDWGHFQAIRQDVLLSFMEVVRDAGTSMAFPTQTLHIAGDVPLAGDLTGGNGEVHVREREEPRGTVRGRGERGV